MNIGIEDAVGDGFHFQTFIIFVSVEHFPALKTGNKKSQDGDSGRNKAPGILYLIVAVICAKGKMKTGAG